jgi:hypothetical protein
VPSRGRGCPVPSGPSRKAKTRNPTPPPEEEYEEEEEVEDDDDAIDIHSDPGTPPRPKGKKKEVLSKVEAQWRELKKRDLMNPSIRQTRISPNAWPSAQADLDFIRKNHFAI